ncbi:HNH endonuclease family protein [Actinomycetaceae bacterium TAE3-ERU4]|nr:HNH endonuclease family protein [Actinomycetaceae bacterium TAE3-ERU4]
MSNNRGKREKRLADIISVLLLAAVLFYLFSPRFYTGLTSVWNWVSKPTNFQVNSRELKSDVADILGNLRVRETSRESTISYRRSDFGEPWFDEDANGCDTRNDILARDLKDVVYRNPRRHCKVVSGVLVGPYTGKVIHFRSGPQTSPLVQIDHVVALGDAWRSGAQQWSYEKRQSFANDPLNLLATDGKTNEDKGSMPAQEWLPPLESYRCKYIQRQIAVKNKWNLSVTRAELTTFEQVLRMCPETSVSKESKENLSTE